MVYILFLEFRPEVLLMNALMLSYRSKAEIVMFLLYMDAGYMPGCMMLRIHHAEIFLESEAYRDGFSLSLAGNITAKAGCYKP